MGSHMLVTMGVMKWWIPIGSMGCVHIHQRTFIIERCDNPNHVQNVKCCGKTRKNNQKVKKTN
jgi:hypothetical protein